MEGRFEASQKRINECLDALRTAAGGDDGGLKRLLDGAQEKILYQLQNLKGKQEQSWQRQWDISRQQVEKARNYLVPRGRRQEEQLNIHYFLIRHGFSFLDMLQDHIRPFTSAHQVVLYP